MNRKLCILIFILALSVVECFSQITNSDDRLRRIIAQDGQAEVTIPYTGKKSAELITTNVSILSVKDNVVYISLSPLTVDWFILQKFDYKIVEKAAAKGLISSENMNQAMDWDTYPTYTQYFILHYVILIR
jgi:hypothetical protein